MDTNLITYLACICFIFIFGRIFIVPLKKILKLVINSIIGGITIYIINLVGTTFGFHIGLNFFTSIVIRITRITRYYLLNYCETFDWIVIHGKYVKTNCNRRKSNTLVVIALSCSIDYSTVTDFAKFLGLSTSNPFSFEI